MNKLMILLFLFFSSLIETYSATYYVDQNGNNASSGTITAPWKTLAYACSRPLIAGDVIFINNGIYSENAQSLLKVGVSIQGQSMSGVIINSIYNASGQPLIKLETTNGWLGTYGNQTISNLTINGNNTTHGCIRVNFRSNVIITYCSISNFTTYGIIYYGMPMYTWSATSVFEADRTMPSSWTTGNKITYCTISNNSGNGSSNIRIGQQDGIEIANCNIIQPIRGSGTNCGGISFTDEGWNKNTKIHDNIINVPINPSNRFNFAIEQWYELGGCEYYNNDITGSVDIDCAIKGASTYSVWIHHNTIGYKSYQYYHHYGINLEANNSDVIVEKNIIQYTHNAVYLSHIWPQSGYGGRDNHPYDNVMTNVRISCNLLLNCGYQINALTPDNWEPVYGINLAGQEDAGRTAYMNNFEIYNNVIHCGSVANGSYYCVGIWLPNQNMAVDGLYIVNNIITGFIGGTVYSAPVFGTGLYGTGSIIDDLTIRNNIFYGNGNANDALYVSGYSAYIKDHYFDVPIKVNPNLSPEYKITSETSSAYHTGYDVNLDTDFDNRPFHITTPSIGAYEFITQNQFTMIKLLGNEPITLMSKPPWVSVKGNGIELSIGSELTDGMELSISDGRIGLVVLDYDDELMVRTSLDDKIPSVEVKPKGELVINGEWNILSPQCNYITIGFIPSLESVSEGTFIEMQYEIYRNDIYEGQGLWQGRNKEEFSTDLLLTQPVLADKFEVIITSI